MQADGQPPQTNDRALWQRSRETNMTPDEAERFLDLAGFADGRLDVEDRARIAESVIRKRKFEYTPSGIQFRREAG